MTQVVILKDSMRTITSNKLIIRKYTKKIRDNDLFVYINVYMLIGPSPSCSVY